MVSQTIYASKDANVNSDDPDANEGTGTGIEIFKNKNGGYRDNIRCLLEFDISSFLDVPIQNVTAYLYLRQYSEDDAIEKSFRKLDAQFTENSVTWNNQPASTDYSITDTWTGTGYKNVNVTTMLKAALRDGHSYLGIQGRYTNETLDGITTHGNSFNARETAGTTYDPYLLITYDTYSQTRLKGSLCKNLLDKDGFGEITMTDHNCPSPCDAATFTFKTAWGTTYTTVLLDVGDTQQYDNGTEHHSFKLYSMAAESAPCDNLAAATIQEKYWKDNCYVKTTGDNDRNGTSWTEAWKTVDQGANEAFDGQEVHIGFGTYNAEPANNDITPVNFGTTGIKYTPETATTGGGTGSVTVERN